MLAVEEVRRADQRRRFLEIGRVLFADEPRWAPPLRSYEQWVFDRRHPWRRNGGEVARFLVRRSGAVVGRVVRPPREGSADGAFGAFECDDDAAAVAALVGACASWLRDRGATTVTGPMTYTAADDAGVLVAGFEHGGGTGRPWHPPWYAEHLAAAGLEPGEGTYPRWRLRTAPGPRLPEGGPAPPHAGRLTDGRLVLDGDAGAVAAVPDIAAAVRIGTAAAFRVRPTEAAVVRCDGDPSRLVPAVLSAAAAAGYDHVWAPWSPDESPPTRSTACSVRTCGDFGGPDPHFHRTLPLVADRN